MNNLFAAEAADIACGMAHYALLSESEVEHRCYKSCKMSGALLVVETRNGVRKGRVAGFGLTEKCTRESLDAALAWLYGEGPQQISVRVPVVEESAGLIASLQELGFKQSIRVCQWVAPTGSDRLPVVSAKRRTPMDHTFSIREIDAAMAQEYAAIIAVNYRFKQGTDVGWWVRLVGSAGYTAFMAFSGDEPVGTGGLHSQDGASVLGYGTTLKAYRKRGIQNGMIAARVRKAEELGCSLITASTWGTDQSSRNIRRNGFELAGAISVYSLQLKSPNAGKGAT